MAIVTISIIGLAVGITSLGVSTYQYSKNVDRMNAQEKKADKRLEASKTRDQEMAKRQLRQAAFEVGKRQLEMAIAKRKKTSAMHEAQDSKVGYTVQPNARPMGRPVIG